MLSLKNEKAGVRHAGMSTKKKKGKEREQKKKNGRGGGGEGRGKREREGGILCEVSGISIA